MPLAIFDEDCIFRTWALQAMERAGVDYRIVYVSHSLSGILDAVRAGLAIAPIVKSNVPADLIAVGIEKGLPVLPISNIVLHTVRNHFLKPYPALPTHFIKAFREKH